MTRYAGLLRGVNVGGRNAVSMKALAGVVEGLGYTDVSTYLQSGNVLFTTSAGAQAVATALTAALHAELGRAVDVVVRTHAELARTIEKNPFPDGAENPKTLHVTFLAAAPSAADKAKVKAIDAGRFAPEELAIVGKDVYLHLPGGIGRSKLAAAVTRTPLGAGTARNWTTVTKLADLTGG